MPEEALPEEALPPGPVNAVVVRDYWDLILVRHVAGSDVTVTAEEFDRVAATGALVQAVV